MIKKDFVYLIQNDTTVGFCSQNEEKLAKAKQRNKSQKNLQTLASFSLLKERLRVPSKYKKLVRRAKKTTFVLSSSFFLSQAFRIIPKNEPYYKILRDFTYLFSSSANKTKQNFSLRYAKDNADIWVEDFRGFSQKSPSKILKLSKNKIIKIR